MTDLEFLDSLADLIGDRIASGNLPPKDANGFYIMDHAAAEMAAQASQ